MYNFLCEIASQKLQIAGASLVLESDGTVVDEGLEFFSKHTLLLLARNERWCSGKIDMISLNSASTIDESLCDITDSEYLQSLSTKPVPALVYYNETNEEAENIENSTVGLHTWINYEVPWSQMSKKDLKNCKNNKEDPCTTRNLVKIIVNDMRTYKLNIPLKAFRIVAEKVVKKYPVFMDKKFNGKVYGQGIDGLVDRLINRNNYLNRPSKVSRETFKSKLSPSLKGKKLLSSEAGCSNWQLELKESEDMNSILEKKNLFKELSVTAGDDKFMKFYQDTFPLFQYEIHSSMSIKTLKEEWPHNFSNSMIRHHYEIIMKHKVVFKDKLTAIENKLTRHLEDIETNENFGVEYKVLSLIMTYFKEEISSFMKIELVGLKNFTHFH